MGIYIGGRAAQKIYLGENPVKAIYKGSELVWGNDFNIDRFHELCPAATATAVTIDYKAAIDVSDCTMLGYIDTAETIEVWNKDTEYFVLSDYEIRPRRCYQLFYEFRNIISIIFNNFNTSLCSSFAWMFGKCDKMTNVDVDKFETQSATSMRGMFYYCKSITEINVSNFDMSNVTDIAYMFRETSRLETIIGIENWNTHNITTLMHLFYISRISNINLSKWDVSKCEDFDHMFRDTNITEIDCSSWDMSSATTISGMFTNNPQLTKINVSGWNTHNITDFDWCFNNTGIEELDLTGWTFDNAKTINRFLSYCKNLKTIYIDKNPNLTTSSADTFQSTSNIVGGNGTKFKDGGSDNFCIDTPETPGYLTLKQ